MAEASETIKPKEGAALSEAMEAFKKEFSVNPWSLMENAIKESQGNYGGDVQLRWEVQGNTAGSVPVMELKSNTDGVNSDQTGKADLKWWTSSGHYVEMGFSRDDEWDNWKLSQIHIGSEASESFYPTVKEIAKGLELQVDTLESVPEKPQSKI